MSYQARISVSTKNPDGWIMVEVGVFDADSGEEALQAAQQLSNAYTSGKSHGFRYEPETTSDKDFSTQKTEHKGYARFFYRDEPGDRIEIKSPAPISFGVAHAPIEGQK